MSSNTRSVPDPKTNNAHHHDNWLLFRC